MLNYRESIGRTKRQQEERQRMKAQIEAEQQPQFAQSQNMSQQYLQSSYNHQKSRKRNQAPIYTVENPKPFPEENIDQRNNIEQFVSKPNYGQIFYSQQNKDKYTNEYLAAALEKQRNKFNDLVNFLKNLEAENRQLKSQQAFNSASRNIYGNQSQNEEWINMTPQVRQIIKQKFQQLKDDNDKLRKITVSLLKTQTPINTLGNARY